MKKRRMSLLIAFILGINIFFMNVCIVKADTHEHEFNSLSECECGAVIINREARINFSTIEDFNTWKTSYVPHSIEYDIGEIRFTVAMRGDSGSEITDIPVVRGDPVYFIPKENIIISTIIFKCRQWGTKTQTIILSTSNDGENYTQTDISSSNFNLYAYGFENSYSYKFSFSSTINQVGIESMTVIYQEVCTHENKEKIDALSPTYEQDGNIEYYYCDNCGRKLNIDGEIITDVRLPKIERSTGTGVVRETVFFNNGFTKIFGIIFGSIVFAFAIYGVVMLIRRR